MQGTAVHREGKSLHAIGELEAPGVFTSALASRAQGQDRDVILFVTDRRHTHYAHNLLLNLEELGLARRSLAIASDAEACAKLLARAPYDSVVCGHSRYLRPGANTSINLALRAWHIGANHIFHLWWQRWHYLAWAVRLGYSAMSLDTDISLRGDPYAALFRGALAHHHLFVGLDSEASGTERPGVFPMINVGLVYCRRCDSVGPSQRVIAEVPRRVHALLLGPVRWKTKNRRSDIAERVLWEQDLFKDAIEHVAFSLPPHESRHALGNADTPPRDPAAHLRGWRFDHHPPVPGAPPVLFPWLPLHGRAGGVNSSESLCALPLFAFSPWNVPPHGAACAGQWTRRPSPVLVGHMVGCTSKHLTMRQLGWWHYSVSAEDTGGTVAQAAAAAPMASGAAPLRAVFPRRSRVLVLRSAGLVIDEPSDIFVVWDVLRRFAMLALALGRRAVLPLLPCALGPCAPRVPGPLRTRMVMISMGDGELCNDETRVLSHASRTVPLLRRDVEAPLGWTPSVNTSEWWWDARRTHAGRVRPGCCQAVPTLSACVDASGARRTLSEEPLLCEADLGRLLLEAGKHGAAPLVDAVTAATADPVLVGAWKLPSNWTERSFGVLRRLRSRVLVLDAQHDAAARLPPATLLGAKGVQNRVARTWRDAAVREAAGQVNVYATRCLAALARAR